MHVVVCYDVVDDRRRTKLFQGLKGYLEPVQKSVFEGQIGGRDHARMVAMIEERIDRGEDNVRIYRLCVGCRTVTEHIGVASMVPTEAEDIVI